MIIVLPFTIFVLSLLSSGLLLIIVSIRSLCNSALKFKLRRIIEANEKSHFSIQESVYYKEAQAS